MVTLNYSNKTQNQMANIIKYVTRFSLKHISEEKHSRYNYRQISRDLIKVSVGKITLDEPYNSIQIEMKITTFGKDENENENIRFDIYGDSHKEIDNFIEKSTENYNIFHKREILGKPYTQNIFEINRELLILIVNFSIYVKPKKIFPI